MARAPSNPPKPPKKPKIGPAPSLHEQNRIVRELDRSLYGGREAESRMRRARKPLRPVIPTPSGKKSRTTNAGNEA